MIWKDIISVLFQASLQHVKALTDQNRTQFVRLSIQTDRVILHMAINGNMSVQSSGNNDKHSKSLCQKAFLMAEFCYEKDLFPYRSQHNRVGMMATAGAIQGNSWNHLSIKS